MIHREESAPGVKRDELIIQRGGMICVLRYGLKDDELRAALQNAKRDTDIGHRSLAFYLADLDDRGVHQLWGYSSAVHFACEELEMSRWQARDLLGAGKALEELRLIDGAFADGRLCWSKVRTLCRIVTPETEAAWLLRALELTSHQLDREVKGSERGRLPREDGKGLPEVRLNVSFKGIDPVSHELYEQARSYVCAEVGEAVSPADLLRRLCSSLLEKASEKNHTDVDPSLYRVVIDVSGDGSLSVRSEEGPVPIDRVTAYELVSDRRVEKVLAEPSIENTPLPHGQDGPIPPAMRKQVLARDGFRCVHCQRKVRLNGHHVIWRCNGGRTSPENLSTLCVHCHALVHAGFLRVSGTAPHALKFTAADGRPIGPPESSEPAIRVVKEGGADGTRVPRPKPVSFTELPVTPTELPWWVRHAHLFSFNERRRALEFNPGPPREPAPEVLQPEGAPSSPGHRPASLDAVVGQVQVVETLRLGLEGARGRSQPLDHVLLEGSPGLGKTSLAGALANEMASRLQTTSGPLLKDVSVLCHLLTSAQAGQMIFIDEIHRLPTDVAEVLYEAMEDRTLSIPVICGVESRTLRLKLPPLTVVGATTDPDRLPRPLRDRFPIQLVLQSYSTDELVAILEAEAARNDLTIAPDAASTLAHAAIGTPRKALNLLRRAADACLARTRQPLLAPTTNVPAEHVLAPSLQGDVAHVCQLTDSASSKSAHVCPPSEPKPSDLTRGPQPPDPAPSEVAHVRQSSDVAQSEVARVRRPSDPARSEVAHVRHCITLPDARRALGALGLDARGLDPRQRRALDVLRSRRGRPLGVARLAALLDVPARVWRTLLEPALLRLGLITTTPRGVMLATAVQP